MAADSGNVANQLRNKTTAYQYNCGLNALVHVLIPKMNEIGSIGPVGKDELLRQFSNEYGVNLTWEQLTSLIQNPNLNPVQQEVLLGPVLRRMVGNNKNIKNAEGEWPMLAADEVRIVANKFNIVVESYATHEATKAGIKEHLLTNLEYQGNSNLLKLNTEVARLFAEILNNPNHPQHPDLNEFRAGVASVNQPVPAISTLKLLNVGDHWEYLDPNAPSHNQAYLNGFPWSYDMVQPMVSNALKTIKKQLDQNPAAPIDLPSLFGSFFNSKAKNGTAGSGSTPENIFGAKQGFLETLTNLFTQKPGEQSGIMGFLTKLFSILIEAVTSIFKNATAAESTDSASNNASETTEDPNVSEAENASDSNPDYTQMFKHFEQFFSGKANSAEQNGLPQENPFAGMFNQMPKAGPTSNNSDTPKADESERANPRATNAPA